MKKLIVVGFLLPLTLSCYASDGERISGLEKQVNEIKLRLERVEALLVNSTNSALPLANKDGWKSLSNWRSLKTGMSLNEVRGILGEPHRVKGGNISVWYYENGASVAFMSDQVYAWTEPR